MTREEMREKEELMRKIYLVSNLPSWPKMREFTFDDSVDDMRWALTCAKDVRDQAVSIRTLRGKFDSYASMAAIAGKILLPGLPIDAALGVWKEFLNENMWALEKMAMRQVAIQGTGDPKRALIWGAVTAIGVALLASKFGDKISGMWDLIKDNIPARFAKPLESAFESQRKARERRAQTRSPAAHSPTASAPGDRPRDHAQAFAGAHAATAGPIIRQPHLTAPAAPTTSQSLQQRPQQHQQPAQQLPVHHAVAGGGNAGGAGVLLDPMVVTTASAANGAHPSGVALNLPSHAPVVLETAVGLSAPASAFPGLAAQAPPATAVPSALPSAIAATPGTASVLGPSSSADAAIAVATAAPTAAGAIAAAAAAAGPTRRKRVVPSLANRQ
jgi:hypothetical protein